MNKLLFMSLVCVIVSGSVSAQQACGQGDCSTGVDGFAGHQEAAGGISGTSITETSGVNNPSNDGQISGRIEAFGGVLSSAGQIGGAGVTKIGTEVFSAGQ